MPGSSKARNPSGMEIEFFEDTHKYQSTINGTLVSYVSGTAFIGQFFKPFDQNGMIAKKCAEREGVSVEEIQKRWAETGRQATTLGTRCHECCEDVELGRKELRNTPQNEKEQKMFDNAVKSAKALYNKLDIVGVEKIVFSPYLKIAGTIDLLAKSKKDGSYVIVDHKTNKSIDIEDKWNKFALPPIQHLHDTNFIHYGLQLNLYQYILQSEGYAPRDAKFTLLLNHISEEGNKFIPLPNLQMEIRDMVIYDMLKQNGQIF